MASPAPNGGPNRLHDRAAELAAACTASLAARRLKGGRPLEGGPASRGCSAEAEAEAVEAVAEAATDGGAAVGTIGGAPGCSPTSRVTKKRTPAAPSAKTPSTARPARIHG